MNKGIKTIYKELLFQVVMMILLFLLVAFDKKHPHFHWEETFFLLNYFLMALIVNYFLLPRYYYKRKFGLFAVGFCMVVMLGIVIEEFVLEQIFFPESRGTAFYFLRSLLDVLPLILILVASKFVWDATVNQFKVEHMDRMMAESKLNYLKQQINPHFLFNNLNNLYSYAIENSPKTPQIILELSSLLRYMLYDCKENSVSLRKELEHLNSFIKLNELQLEGKGGVTYETDIESDFYIAPMILIVFVENAFKYSLASQTEEIYIDISVEMRDGRLKFYCENSFDDEVNLKDIAGGIGLQNVQSRLDLQYPDAYELKTHESENRYIVELLINLDRLQQ
ncbi:histidine kinase [Puteibacter caeruleilacunae]|nr:histidine kinase [Puteibacter caeruleilacunae]